MATFLDISCETEKNSILTEIDEKYDSFDHEEESKDDNDRLAFKLSEELDALGIAVDYKNKDIVNEVLVISFSLINLYRKTLTHANENNSFIKKLQLDNLKLLKKLDECRNQILQKEDKANVLHKKLVILQLEYEDVLKEKSKILQELLNVKKAFKCKENSLQHKIKQVQVDCQLLQDSIMKNIGNYTSTDDIIAHALHKYKTNEEVYKNTIQKLQENNHGLLVEILNLKEEIVLALLHNKSI